MRKEHKTIQSLTKKLKNKGLKAEGLLIQGATSDMVLKESEKLNADLIIIGHHEHGLLYKFLQVVLPMLSSKNLKSRFNRSNQLA